MLMTGIVVSAENRAFVGQPNTFFFDSGDCEEEGVDSWLPNESIRESWGARPSGYGKWGYTANLPPYSPRYQKTGHPADIFDGDNTSGYVWKTVSLSGDNCPADSTNCQVITLDDEVITEEDISQEDME